MSRDRGKAGQSRHVCRDYCSWCSQSSADDPSRSPRSHLSRVVVSAAAIDAPAGRVFAGPARGYDLFEVAIVGKDAASILESKARDHDGDPEDDSADPLASDRRRQ